MLSKFFGWIVGMFFMLLGGAIAVGLCFLLTSAKFTSDPQWHYAGLLILMGAGTACFAGLTSIKRAIGSPSRRF